MVQRGGFLGVRVSRRGASLVVGCVVVCCGGYRLMFVVFTAGILELGYLGIVFLV